MSALVLKLVWYSLKGIGYVTSWPGNLLYSFAVKKLTPVVTTPAV